MVIHTKLFLSSHAVKHVKFGMGQPQLHKIAWYILSKKLIEFVSLFIYYKQYKYPEFRNQRSFFQPSQILLRPAAPLPYRVRAPTRTEASFCHCHREMLHVISPASVRVFYSFCRIRLSRHMRSGSGDEIRKLRGKNRNE